MSWLHYPVLWLMYSMVYICIWCLKLSITVFTDTLAPNGAGPSAESVPTINLVISSSEILWLLMISYNSLTRWSHSLVEILMNELAKYSVIWCNVPNLLSAVMANLSWSPALVPVMLIVSCDNLFPVLMNWIKGPAHLFLSKLKTESVYGSF